MNAENQCFNVFVMLYLHKLHLVSCLEIEWLKLKMPVILA
jgi:hypothetical protein